MNPRPRVIKTVVNPNFERDLAKQLEQELMTLFMMLSNHMTKITLTSLLS